jgi:hypothetical protein
VRRTPRCRTILAAGAALLLAGATLTTGAEPAVAAGPVRVMHFNICGAICNHGVVAKVGGGNDIVDDARRRIVNFKPAIVTLNEVCVGQFNRLKSLLNGGGWTMNGAFRAQRSDGRCRGGSGFGDAIFTARSINGQKVIPLPNAGEHRAILCIRTAAGGGPVLACVLHTVTDNPLKSRQVAAATVAANAAATQGPVIVGGDFNTTPSGMGALLDPARGGRFFDVDPQKAGTRGNKIDYILFSRAHFANPSGGPQPSQYSDHDVLVGQATRR